MKEIGVGRCRSGRDLIEDLVEQLAGFATRRYMCNSSSGVLFLANLISI